MPRAGSKNPKKTSTRRTYQRRRGGGGVQKGREVLVCVRVLVLVVVLMELKGEGRDAGLVLRGSA